MLFLAEPKFLVSFPPAQPTRGGRYSRRKNTTDTSCQFPEEVNFAARKNSQFPLLFLAQKLFGKLPLAVRLAAQTQRECHQAMKPASTAKKSDVRSLSTLNL